MTAIRESPMSAAAPQSASRLAGNLLLILIALVFLRPWDYVPALAAARPASLMILTVVLAWLLNKPQIRAFADPPSKPLWMLLGVVAATAPLSYWPTKSGEIAFQLLQQLTIFTLIAHLVTSKADLGRLTTAIVACGALHGGYTTWTYLAGDFGPEDRVFGAGSGEFADPNDLALSLVMILPLAWWRFQSASAGSQRVVAFAAMSIVLAGILASQSRGGVIALGASMLFIGYRSRESRAYLLKTLAVAVMAVLFVFPSGAFDRYASIPQYQSDESAMTRLAVWKAGMRMFADHPLTGVGAGTFELVYGNQYIDRQGAGNVWRAAHSSYIQVAAELGVFGLAAWIALIGSGFLTSSRARQALQAGDPDSREVRMWVNWADAATASVVGYLVGAAFLSRAFDTVFVIVLGMAAACLRIALADSTAEVRSGRVDWPAPHG